MAQEDLKNNRNVRSVLVRHWIDLGRVAINSANGSVTIRGSMQLLRGVKNELDSRAMENIFHEIKRIGEIKRLVFLLDNWSLTDGVWQRTNQTQSTDRSTLEGDHQSVYEM